MRNSQSASLLLFRSSITEIVTWELMEKDPQANGLEMTLNKVKMAECRDAPRWKPARLLSADKLFFNVSLTNC